MVLDQVTALPVAEIQAAFERTEAEIKRLSEVKKLLVRAVEIKFADDIGAMGTGSLTIENRGVMIKVTRPKIVTWDQTMLSNLYQEIAEQWNDDPTEYIKAKYSVSEDAYNGWPTLLRKRFEDARTVKAGATSLKFAHVPQGEV